MIGSHDLAAKLVHQQPAHGQRIVAKASGRAYEDVAKDFRTDSWYNPVESLFYGPKGLIDGILVGPDKVITRAAMEDYLKEIYGSKKAVLKKAEEAINSHREIEKRFEVSDHDENDPFRNPLKTIQEVITLAVFVAFSVTEVAVTSGPKGIGSVPGSRSR